MPNKTHEIELTPTQVRDTMDSFLVALADQWPDEEVRHNILMAKLNLIDRQFLRDDILPRVEGCDELEWIKANGAKVAVKSSIQQFCKGIFKVQVLDKDVDAAFAWWRDN